MKVIKDIPNFIGYKVDNYGNIYSYKTKGGFDFNKIPKCLKQSLDSKKNYLQVVLRRDNKSFTKTVHSIVCSVFNEQKSKKYWVSHENGNSKDNRACNLKWKTASDNHKLKIIHGTDDCGYRNSRALFNKKDIQKIRKLLNSNTSIMQVSKIMKCSYENIRRIKKRERYARN